MFYMISAQWFLSPSIYLRRNEAKVKINNLVDSIETLKASINQLKLHADKAEFVEVRSPSTETSSNDPVSRGEKSTLKQHKQQNIADSLSVQFDSIHTVEPFNISLNKSKMADQKFMMSQVIVYLLRSLSTVNIYVYKAYLMSMYFRVRMI